jgi:hypothetical protein
MKQVMGYALVLVVAGSLAAVAFAQRTELRYSGPSQGRTNLATPSGNSYPARWEYGRLRYTPLQTDWSWRSGPETIKGDAATLWRKFDGPQRATSGEIWYGELLSVLGQQGWEVMVMRDYEGGSEIWFRRPAR